MGFNQLTGYSADGFFSVAMPNQYRLKYFSVDILPLPLITDLGIKEVEQLPSLTSSAESVRQYKVLMPKFTLTKLFANKITAETAILDAQLAAWDITIDQYNEQLAALQRKYREWVAIGLNSTWQLDNGDGNGWVDYRVTGDPMVDSGMFQFTLAALGV